MEYTIISQPKDLNVTHPYFTSDAIDEINTLQQTTKLTPYGLQAIVCKHKVKEQPLYHNYTDRRRYSQSFVEWVAKNLTEQSSWLSQATENYKNERAVKGKVRKKINVK